MASQYFVKRGDQVFGPYESSKVRELARTRRVARDDFVGPSRSGPWVQACKVKGLFPIDPPAVPPSPMVESPTRATGSANPTAVTAVSSASTSAFTVATDYVGQSLIPGEREVFRTRLHWIAFVPFTVPIASGVMTLLMSLIMSDIAQWGLQAMGAVLILVGGVGLALAVIKWRTSEFAVTTHRAIIKTGVISRNTSDLFLNKIDSIALSQTLFGRMFGYGSVLITVSVQRNTYPLIDRPMEFVRAVQRQQALRG